MISRMIPCPQFGFFVGGGLLGVSGLRKGYAIGSPWRGLVVRTNCLMVSFCMKSFVSYSFSIWTVSPSGRGLPCGRKWFF